MSDVVANQDEKRPLLVFLNEVAGGRKLLQAVRDRTARGDISEVIVTAPQNQPSISQIVLVYSADKKIAINHQDVQLPELEEKLRTIFEDRKDKTMFIDGDGALRYGDIINVIDAAKGAGVEKVGIVTEGMRKAGGATPGA